MIVVFKAILKIYFICIRNNQNMGNRNKNILCMMVNISRKANLLINQTEYGATQSYTSPVLPLVCSVVIQFIFGKVASFVLQWYRVPIKVKEQVHSNLIV